MTCALYREGSLVGDQSGVVFAEFLVAFIPLWVFFLSVVQLALISHADLVVRHAADSAARSAAVTLPDDPAAYGGSPKMVVDRSQENTGEISAVLRSLSSSFQESGSAGRSVQGFANLGSSRMGSIRLAAHVPLMSLAPLNVGPDPRPSLRKAIGTKRRLLSALYYQPFAVSVTFPNVTGDVVDQREITARVTYIYQCTVPVGRRVLCSAPDALREGGDRGEGVVEIARQLIGGRFRQLQHDTTLLIHDAPYEYRPEDAS